MSWTYSGDPSSSDRDEVRFLIQDTDPQTPLLQDEEIDFILSKWNPVYGSNIYCAAVACEIVAAQFAREVSVSADGVSVQIGELQDRYRKLASALRDQYKDMGANDVDPDLSALDAAWTMDPSIRPLLFGVGFMDNWEVGRQDFGGYRPGSSPGYWSEGQQGGLVDLGRDGEGASDE